MRAAILILVVVTLAACRPDVPAPRGSVERLTVHAEPSTDGSLLVREDYTIRADNEGRVQFARTVETREADGLELRAVSVDDVATSPASAGLEVDLGDNRVSIVWATSGVRQAERRLTLTFRAVSAIAVTDPRATTSWPVLPPNRGYAVGAVHVMLALPVDAGVYPGTGMSEAGWTVERTREGVTAMRAPVPDAESATLVASFDFERRGVRDPVWERNRDRQRQFWPAFLAGALFFLVIGVGTIIILRLQYPRAGRRGEGSSVLPSAEERDVVVRGLWQTGLAGVALSVAFALVGYGVLGFLGPWLYLIPASMLFVSVSFLGVAERFR